jgi:drug/metabolite transporter (DMT)-like permease
MRPHLRLLLTGALFSTGGALIKSCSFPALQRAGVRSAIAALLLFVLLPEARRLPSRRTLLLLPAYIGATCLFVVSNTLTTAANAIFLQSTYPLWVTLLGPLLLRERPTRSDLAVLLCIVAGMSLFFVAPTEASAIATDPRLGDVLACVSGLSFGLLLIGFRWLGRSGRGEQSVAVAWGNVIAAPAALLLAPFVGQTPIAGDAASWGAIAFLGVFQIALPYAILMRTVAHVPAIQASLLLMIEPALNPILTFVLLGERPHALAVVGGALILGAVVLGAVLSARTRRSPPAA